MLIFKTSRMNSARLMMGCFHFSLDAPTGGPRLYPTPCSIFTSSGPSAIPINSARSGPGSKTKSETLVPHLELHSTTSGGSYTLCQQIPLVHYRVLHDSRKSLPLLLPPF